MIFCIFQWLGLKTGNVSTSLEWYSPSSDPPPLPPKKTGATVSMLSNTVHVFAVFPSVWVRAANRWTKASSQFLHLCFLFGLRNAREGKRVHGKSCFILRKLFSSSFFKLSPLVFVVFSSQDNLGPLYLPRSILSLGFICLYSADKFTCLQVLQVVCEFQSV